MKNLLNFNILFWFFFQSAVQAEALSLTDEIKQHMTYVLPMIEKDLYNKSSCIDNIKSSRFNEKGILLEVFFKQGDCIKKHHLSQIRKQTLAMFFNLSFISEIIESIHRGLFIEYVYKLNNGKRIGRFRVDRETLFWKPFSHLIDPHKDSEYIRISLNSQVLFFLSKDMILETFPPGYPMSHKYCDIEFKEELYYFTSKKLSLNLSVIALSNSWPETKQLNCINHGDFVIQKGRPEKYRIETPNQIQSDLLNPVYKIITKVGQKEEVDYALSFLIGKRFVIYMVFSGSNDFDTQKLIDGIISSFKLETRKTEP